MCLPMRMQRMVRVEEQGTTNAPADLRFFQLPKIVRSTVRDRISAFSKSRVLALLGAIELVLADNAI